MVYRNNLCVSISVHAMIVTVYNGKRNDVTVETDMEIVWEVMSQVPTSGCVPD